MSTILLLIILNFTTDTSWQIRDTEIYRQLKTGQVAYSQDHGWYLLDVIEQRILNYDVHGVFVRTVAKAGQGPAELNKIQYISFENGVLYAVSLHRVKKFKGSGGFLKQMTRTDYTNWLMKIPNGWLAYPHYLNSRSQQNLVMYDDELKNEMIITEWVTRVIKKKGSFPYRPDIFSFAVDRGQNVVYLRKPDTNTVEVWDLSSHELKRTFKLGIKLDPDAQFKLVVAEAKKRKTGLKTNSWYPDMKIGPKGSLYFFPIRTKENALIFDPQGKKIAFVFNNEVLDRILRVDNDLVYISWYDVVSEEIGIKRTTHTDVSAIVAANPIPD